MQIFKIAVLISGNGSNLQAIIDNLKNQEYIGICSVISNKKDAYGLTRAIEAGIDTYVINHEDYSSREAFEEELIEVLRKQSPDLIVLAGFMRILSKVFVSEYYGKLINIHPSLLPKYKGMNTHQRVIEAGEELHGVTVHYVDNSLDGGPICAQSSLTINTKDKKELENQIHELEYKLYPEVIREIAAGKIRLSGGEVYRE